MNFVDRARIQVRGGNGGAGVASFLRRKGQPRGKPTGGSGGSGGAVVIEADASVSSLLSYGRQSRWVGGDGTHAEGDLRHGAHGEDAVLPVPLGTIVRDEDGTMLADLTLPGQRVTVVEGGRGGKGNAAFVAPKRRAPSFAEQGEYGEERSIVLEFKIIADAALVGFPNAGKSTLIARVSAARPKIADYPFTTLTPNLGVVSIAEREFVLADIPGLIEGAAEGKGLGHEFLRHVERARVLVILLDPTDMQDTPYPQQYRVLVQELEHHSAELAARPRLVAVNKRDVLDDLAEVVAWADASGLAVHPISAVTGDGTEALMHAVADEVEQHLRDTPEREGFVLHRPLPPSFSVQRDQRGEGWVVEGRAAERAVNLDDLTSPQAADFAAQRLARIGVDEALTAAGAVAGDDVRIADLVFTFDPDLLDSDTADSGSEDDGSEAGST